MSDISALFVPLNEPLPMCVFSKLNPAKPVPILPAFVAELTVTVPATVVPENGTLGTGRPQPCVPLPASDALCEPEAPDDSADPDDDVEPDPEEPVVPEAEPDWPPVPADDEPVELDPVLASSPAVASPLESDPVEPPPDVLPVEAAPVDDPVSLVDAEVPDVLVPEAPPLVFSALPLLPEALPLVPQAVVAA